MIKIHKYKITWEQNCNEDSESEEVMKEEEGLQKSFMKLILSVPELNDDDQWVSNHPSLNPTIKP